MKEKIKILFELTKIKIYPAVMVHTMTGFNYFKLSEFDYHGLVHDRQEVSCLCNAPRQVH